MRVPALILVLAAAIAGCWKQPAPIDPAKIDSARNAHIATDDPLGEPVQKVVFLDQNWTPEEGVRFYFTSQGSEIIPYAWFLALEQPGATTLFRDNQNMMRYRYLPQKPGPMNPDGLPVGFVGGQGKSERWLGMSCAACHTGEIRYGDVAYRVDGAPTQADTQAFFSDLVVALRQTRDEPAKFARFADRVLAADRGDAQKRQDLAAKLDFQTKVRDGYNQRNFFGYDTARTAAAPPTHYGRLDAVDAIVNEVYWHAVNQPDPDQPTVVSRPADAPVSFPCIWDTPQHKLVEWLGIAQSGGIGDIFSLSRNTGEVLGVFGDFDIPADSPLLPGYASSVKFNELNQLEALVKQLWSPLWPAGFPPIDRDKAAKGAALYEARLGGGGTKSCKDCHAIINRTDPARVAHEQILIGETDRRAYDNFFGPERSAGRLEGRKISLLSQERIGEEADANTMLSHTVQEVVLGFWREAPQDKLDEVNFQGGEQARAAVAAVRYKARPLNGIWATAPYLHNGSVPNLDALLRPAVERPKSFTIGNRTFDPVRVGFVTDAKGFPRFEVVAPDGTPITGNSNAGHEYGAHLGDEEREQLIEYLKTL
jgi:cytochrome c peroxidase